MLATVWSAALVGLQAEPVLVEVNTHEKGEPRLVLVGLPDNAVKESCDRVYTALIQSGTPDPFRTRTTINLAPAHLRKEGPMYDLPIALGVLASMEKLPSAGLDEYLIAGELGLSGSTRAVRGALAIAQLARKLRKKAVILPPVSAEEAALVAGIPVYLAPSLAQVAEFLRGNTLLAQAAPLPLAGRPEGAGAAPAPEGPDFSDLKGQSGLRRAIEVAVAGAHNILMIGPPGSGKSMAAKRIAGIMPPPTPQEWLEILGIQSIAGKTLQPGACKAGMRPFRAPHHTVSDVALLGGGSIPGPGEISLAHHGVLFLDELPEFRRSVLQVLRQPLEDGEVSISRRAAKLSFPCVFMLVAAMNPCPCGHLGDPRHACRCTPTQIDNYRRRVGGPLLDWIDLHIQAPALTMGELRSEEPAESSTAILDRVLRAREIQKARFGDSASAVNARMSHRQLRQHCALDSTLGDLLHMAMERLGLSARAYDRILKVSRTIADLAGKEKIEGPHLLEAIQYRILDRPPSET